MIAFALQWEPYGGGSAEDIVVEFGLTPIQYFTRLRELMRDADTDVSADARLDIVRTCRNRLESVSAPEVGR